MMRMVFLFVLPAAVLQPSDSIAAPRGTNGRLHVAIVDERTGTPLPARVHLKDAQGTEIKTKAYPYHKGHFTCPGSFHLQLPTGQYAYEIEHGQQWSMASGTVRVEANTVTEHIARIRELIDITQEGWWSGDLHVHRPIEDMALLMEAEDIHIAPSITWWNQKSIWRDGRLLPTDPLVRHPDGRCNHVMAGEDERAGGALLYFHLDRPMDIRSQNWEFPSPMKFLAQARQQPDVHVDIEKPFWWDVPVWLASGQIDTIGIANNHMCRDWVYNNPQKGGEAWGKPRDNQRLPHPHGNGHWSQEIYYHALNAGLRIPPSAGSASGVLPNPLGYNRVWVHVGKKFDREQWWKNLRAGRSFVSNGPLLRVHANGQLPGHVFKASAGNPLRIDLNAKIFTRDTISNIEVIKNGKVAALIPYAQWRKNGSLGSISFDESGWFLVRAIADNAVTFRFASTAPFHVEIGDHPRRISRQSAQFFLDWTGERIARISLTDKKQLEAVLAPHRKAETFWKRKLSEANAE